VCELRYSPTHDPALNKMVAARIRKRFAAGEKLIRTELMSVYLLSAAAAAPEG
jgi:hypothetical protein